MLEDTGSSGTASGLETGWDGDGESGVICGCWTGVVGEVAPGNEHVTDYGVGSGVDDTRVGNTRVRCADIELEVNYLSSGP